MRGYEMFLMIKYFALIVGGVAGVGFLLSRPRW